MSDWTHISRGCRIAGRLAALAVLLSCTGGPLSAAETPVLNSPPGKDGYHLFNPVPAAMLRDMSTDRPDLTESPYTVDAGHFQIELDLITGSQDRHNPARTDTRVDTWSVAPVNLKVGLCNSVDLQLVVQPYNEVRTDDRSTGTLTRNRGFGDVVTRIKWNWWGNDGGRTAFAIMPYGKFPTSQDQLGNGSVEGGLILPLAVELPAGWGMGLMTQYDVVRDGATSGYHPEFVNSITLSHEIVGNLEGYVEFATTVSSEAGADWVGTIDVGLTYGLTKHIQLDAGVNIGVTRAAEDLHPFIGISIRF